MTLITTLVIPVIVAALVPLASFATAGIVSQGRKRRANARLRAAPLVYKGAEFSKIYIDGAGGLAEICGKCYVSALEVGRVEVIMLPSDGTAGDAMSFTGEEFEALHPVWCGSTNAKRRIDSRKAIAVPGK